ncbi:hypothetical protein [Vagococcus elongatus]
MWGGLVYVYLKIKFFNKGEQKRGSPRFFYVMIISFILTTFFLGGKIVISAIPYNGALSWKLEAFFRKKEVPMTDPYFFKEGLNGIIKDLDKSLDLPDKLYIVDDFSIQMDENGKIKKINSFLYGRDEKEQKKTFLISYDVSKNKNQMEVWLDYETNSD